MRIAVTPQGQQVLKELKNSLLNEINSQQNSQLFEQSVQQNNYRSLPSSPIRDRRSIFNDKSIFPIQTPNPIVQTSISKPRGSSFHGRFSSDSIVQDTPRQAQILEKSFFSKQSEIDQFARLNERNTRFNLTSRKTLSTFKMDSRNSLPYIKKDPWTQIKEQSIHENQMRQKEKIIEKHLQMSISQAEQQQKRKLNQRQSEIQLNPTNPQQFFKQCEEANSILKSYMSQQSIENSRWKNRLQEFEKTKYKKSFLTLPKCAIK